MSRSPAERPVDVAAAGLPGAKGGEVVLCESADGEVRLDMRLESESVWLTQRQMAQSPDDMAAYLEAALDDGDVGLIAAALGDIARARGMTEISRKAGLGRESLYKALSPGGNPELGTVLKVVRALGLKLHATAA